MPTEIELISIKVGQFNINQGPFKKVAMQLKNKDRIHNGLIVKVAIQQGLDEDYVLAF